MKRYEVVLTQWCLLTRSEIETVVRCRWRWWAWMAWFSYLFGPNIPGVIRIDCVIREAAP